MRIIARRVGCPIATGERLLTHKEYEDLCNLKSVTYVQPDLCHCGGFTVGKQIAATAAANYIGVCPHNPMGPIAGAVGLHFGVAVPNFVILDEKEAARHPFQQEEVAGLEAVVGRDGSIANW
jgi:galactonate dehydratase